jgi:tRNA nucleotidyltransferase (CCA-adding enzyme)
MWRPWENDFESIRDPDDNSNRNIAAEVALDQLSELVVITQYH